MKDNCYICGGEFTRDDPPYVGAFAPGGTRYVSHGRCAE